ncbi:Segregation and condensation protein A [bacterium HR40]|nr:Segregation and condensation protein A [bacterium HR40]
MNAPREEPSGEALTLSLEAFSGPLELLLELARAQKVDLARISILELVDQYLAWLERARELRLALAADYLVMAAWLVYLKSQLLLPVGEREEPEIERQAVDLADRLRLLEAIRRAADWLAERPCLGDQRLPRGAPERPAVERQGPLVARLAELLQAWAAVARRAAPQSVELPPRRWVSVEQVLDRIARQLVGRDWQRIERFLPAEWRDELLRRSAMASGLVAALELARRGEIDLYQPEPFGPIFLRRRA